MHPKFAALIDSLESKRLALLAMPSVRYGSLPRGMPKRGIYLFSEDGRHLYVGRTNRLKVRLGEHCRPKSPPSKAAFAARIAREVTGKLQATYRAETSRNALLSDPAFVEAFTRAKTRLAGCELRFLAEEEPTTQALLEIYVATVLETPYNDFDNH